MLRSWCTGGSGRRQANPRSTATTVCRTENHRTAGGCCKKEKKTLTSKVQRIVRQADGRQTECRSATPGFCFVDGHGHRPALNIRFEMSPVGLDDGKTVTWMGCFKDNDARTPFDASHGVISSSSGCAKAAVDAGHGFFGYEYGGHCFSSSTWEKAVSLGPSTECSMTAGGIRAGGPWLFDLYGIDDATKQAYAFDKVKAHQASVDFYRTRHRSLCRQSWRRRETTTRFPRSL